MTEIIFARCYFFALSYWVGQGKSTFNSEAACNAKLGCRNNSRPMATISEIPVWIIASAIFADVISPTAAVGIGMVFLILSENIA